MSKFSKVGAEAGAAKWTMNVKSNKTKRRANLPELKNSIGDSNRMPLNKKIIGRYLGLHAEMRGSKDRVNKIYDEVMHLWMKLDFPVLSERTVKRKLQKLVDLYEKYRREPTQKFEKRLSDLFDITNINGEWRNIKVDKKLYEQQVKSKGKVGYTTSQIAPLSTIHPSKRRRLTSETSEVSEILSDFSLETIDEAQLEKRC